MNETVQSFPGTKWKVLIFIWYGMKFLHLESHKWLFFKVTACRDQMES